MSDLGALFLSETLDRLRGVKQLGEGALRQLDPAQWHLALGPNGNSAAVLVQHLSGNMRSRWTGFPKADGEAATRDRDAEFEDAHHSTEVLWAQWEAGWAACLDALVRLAPGDLTREVRIRGEAHSVLGAIQRQLAHSSGHVYQIVMLARHLRGPAWQTLSIARGGSAAFNAEMWQRHGQRG